MKKVKGIKKYAKQLVKNIDLKDLPQAIEHLNAVAVLMDRDRNFRNLMTSPVFSGEETRKVLSFLVQKIGMPDRTAKYLGYLSESGVISALHEIVKAVTAFYLEAQKRTQAVVSAPVEVSSENRNRIISSLRQVTGKDIDVEFVIDQSLLGGLRVKVGSTMYDSSIKGQLGLLRDKLIKG